MSAAVDLSPILPRVRAAGGDAVLRDRRPVLLRPSALPPALLSEVKARRDDLIGELHDEADVDAAFDGEERAAIQADGDADPAAAVLHEMPVSWADPLIEPTAGARCRCCGGSRWWCEAIDPRGWRCSTCHPGHHLPSERRREVRT